MFFSILEMVIVFGVLGLVLLICGRVVFRATTAGRKGTKVPSCEKCKYPIEGLTGFQCPECGSDIRQVGIITRAMEIRRRGTYTGAILSLTLGVVILGFVGFGFAMDAYWKWGGGPVVTSTMTATTPLTPSSSAYASVDIEISYNTSGGTTLVGPSTTVAYRLSMFDGSQWVLSFDVTSKRVTVIDDRGGQSDLGSIGVKRSTFKEFFEAAGLDTSKPSISVEVSDLFGSANSLVKFGPASSSDLTYVAFTVGLTNYKTTPLTAVPRSSSVDWELVIAWSAFAISAVLWLCGLAWIILRRRKLLREYAPGCESSVAEPAKSAVVVEP